MVATEPSREAKRTASHTEAKRGHRREELIAVALIVLMLLLMLGVWILAGWGYGVVALLLFSPEIVFLLVRSRRPR